jgi:hypothetical protein
MKLMMDLGRERKSPNQQMPVLKSLKVSGRLKLIFLEGFEFQETLDFMSSKLQDYIHSTHSSTRPAHVALSLLLKKIFKNSQIDR